MCEQGIIKQYRIEGQDKGIFCGSANVGDLKLMNIF